MAKDASLINCPNCDSKYALLMDECITCPDCGYDEFFEKNKEEEIRQNNIKEYEEYN